MDESTHNIAACFFYFSLSGFVRYLWDCHANIYIICPIGLLTNVFLALKRNQCFKICLTSKLAKCMYDCNVRKPIGDISLDGLGQDWTLRRYILHLNDI